MHLSQVSIDDYRGIRRLAVRLDRTTVVIGENDYGKSSLLDALELCLGRRGVESDPVVEERDFHVPAGGGAAPADEIRIRLTFRPEDPEEVSAFEREQIVPRLPRLESGTSRRGSLVMEMTARRGGGVVWRALDEEGAPIDGIDDAVMRELRRLHPFVLLRGSPGGMSPAASPRPLPRSAEDAALEETVEQVEQVYRRLVTSRVPLPEAELRAGMAALGSVLERHEDRLFETPRRRSMIEDLVQSPVRLVGGPRSRLARMLDGSGTQSLGTLVLFGAFLEARGGSHIDPEARVIVGIEQPEANLHPIMLASVWAIIVGLNAQKVVTTNSGELMASVPLRSIRRLGRRDGVTRVFRLRRKKLSPDEQRRIAYHIRVRRGEALFARCWLLVEGETEFWLLHELARQCGYHFPAEGVSCIEFAQSGLRPLIKFAVSMGIEWHVLADGDRAGRSYADVAKTHEGGDAPADRITLLEDRDIEHCFWNHGYDHVFRKAAGARYARDRDLGRRSRPTTIIQRAVKARKKPALALAVLEAVAKPGSRGVPPPLLAAIETSVRLARSAASGQ